MLCELNLFKKILFFVMLAFVGSAMVGCALTEGLFSGDGVLNLDQLNNLDISEIAGLDLDQLPTKELMTLLGVAYGINPAQAEAAMQTAAAVGIVPAQNVQPDGTDKAGKKFQPIKLLPAYPVHVEGDCIHGGAIVKVVNIPIMTMANREQYNKTLLFALESENGENIIAVYHRWADNGGQTNWFPAWRMEAGNCQCIEEFHIYQAQHLPGDSAVFEIAWDRNTVRVRLKGSSEQQVLHTVNSNAFSDITADVQCYNEMHSPAAAILKTWTCETGGSSGDCQ